MRSFALTGFLLAQTAAWSYRYHPPYTLMSFHPNTVWFLVFLSIVCHDFSAHLLLFSISTFSGASLMNQILLEDPCIQPIKDYNTISPVDAPTSSTIYICPRRARFHPPIHPSWPRVRNELTHTHNLLPTSQYLSIHTEQIHILQRAIFVFFAVLFSLAIICVPVQHQYLSI